MFLVAISYHHGRVLTLSDMRQLLQPSCNVTQELSPTQDSLSAAPVSSLPMELLILLLVKPGITVHSMSTRTLPPAT